MLLITNKGYFIAPLAIHVENIVISAKNLKGDGCSDDADIENIKVELTDGNGDSIINPEFILDHTCNSYVKTKTNCCLEKKSNTNNSNFDLKYPIYF